MNLCDQTSELDGSSIIKIITACRENGVQQFEFQSLRLNFEPPKAVETPVYLAPEDPAQVARDTEIQELRMQEESIANLRLSDPLQYEELMRHNELEIQDA